MEDLRIDHDKTQSEVADYLGCQREVYRRYEKGTRQIPIDLLMKLSTLYEVNLDYMVGLTDIKRPYPRK
ncbi:MAG: helix-turn-helix domain-containing protein [Dorea sp.]